MAANDSESLESLNERFADALLPLTITFGVFTLIGFLGNLLIMLVFFLGREYRNNNFKIFVLCLAIIDFITCITLIPAEMVKQRGYFSFTDAMACKVKCFFNVFGASASCLALLVISVDRFRKACQPLRKQMTPGMAIKLLIVFAFGFPIMLSWPGSVMCGIEKANKTNINGGYTEIYLCATEEQYKESVLRKVYKFTFILLLVGISLTYIILYTFVMKEVVKQIKSLATHRHNSSFDASFSTDTYEDSNSVALDEQTQLAKPPASKTFSSDSSGSSSRSIRMKLGSKHKMSFANRQASVRSTRSTVGLIRQGHFPYKTMIWFILTIVFIVTYITHLLLALRVGDVVTMTTGEFATYSFFFRIYFVNHMINPLVYAVFVKRFRKSCQTLIPTIRKRIKDLCGS